MNRTQSEALLLSLDEKAFDRLGWPFLFATLRRVGTRGPFLQAVAHVYSSPLVLVRTQFTTSPTFPISNNLPRQTFYSYLQIRHFAQSLVANLSVLPCDRIRESAWRAHPLGV